jgi:hypothetical protein
MSIETSLKNAKWEYLSLYLDAGVNKHKNYVQAHFPGMKMGKFSPRALIPELNNLGEEGWELISIEPVYTGSNADVMVHNAGPYVQWSHTYFCVFKRYKQA